ncbi:MAG: sulfatase-like hydrolase/transferase [Candidatus Eisenbacteria bacterium]
MMKIRLFPPALILLLSATCGEGPTGSARNGILVLIDTCRFDDVGREGTHGPVTPNLDRFAAGGASRFTRCSAPAPWTLPSVGSLLTGVYPTVHGALGRYPDFTKVRADVPTGAELLSAAGFETAAFVNVAFLDPVLGLGRGFDVYDYVGGANRKIRRAGPTFDEAAEWLENRGEGRFFLFIHLFDPHMDFDPVEPFRSRFLEGYLGEMEPPFAGVSRWKAEKEIPPEIRDFARALYRAEIAGVDHEFGRFLGRLDSLDLSEETVVMVTADHGEEFWDHGKFEHGHTLYEELLHVPFLLRAPGRPFEPEIGRLVGLVDVMPTLFDLLGLPVDPGFQGESLLPLLEGEDPPGPRYRFAEALFYGDDWKGVIGERYKYSMSEGHPAGVLFDLEQDPGERRDLAGDRPESAAEMSRILVDWYRGALERTGGSVQGGETVDMEHEVVEQLRALGYAD